MRFQNKECLDAAVGQRSVTPSNLGNFWGEKFLGTTEGGTLLTQGQVVKCESATQQVPSPSGSTAPRP